jgi:hypothetical protein
MSPCHRIPGRYLFGPVIDHNCNGVLPLSPRCWRALLVLSGLGSAASAQGFDSRGQWVAPLKPVGLYCFGGDTLRTDRGSLYVGGCFTLIRDGPAFRANGYLLRRPIGNNPAIAPEDLEVVDTPVNIFEDGGIAIDLHGPNVGGFFRDGVIWLNRHSAGGQSLWWSHAVAYPERTGDDNRLDPDGVYAVAGSVGVNEFAGQFTLVRTGLVDTRTGAVLSVIHLQLSIPNESRMRLSANADLADDGALSFDTVAVTGEKITGRGSVRSGLVELELSQDMSIALRKTLPDNGKQYVRRYHIRGAKLTVPRER